MTAIIDYKAGNLTSVKLAFAALGAEAVVTLEFGLDGGLVDLHFIFSFSLFCAPGSKTLPVVPTWDTERPNFEHPRQG